MLSPHSRAYTILLSALTGLTALSIDMSLPAIPTLQHQFHAPAEEAQLTLSLFLVGYGVGQLVTGPMSDHWGRRPVLIGGLVLYTLAGICCAASPSLEALIALRLMQGLGASVGPILARAIVRDIYEHVEGTVVLSHMTQIMMIAPLLAPTIGGLLLAHVGWRAIFVLLCGFGALMLAVTFTQLAETRKVHDPEEEAPARVIASFLHVLRSRQTVGYIAIIALAYGGMFAYISGAPFVVIEVFHVSTQMFGLYFAVTACGMLIGAGVNRAALRRHSPQTLLRVGVAVLFTAGALLAICSALKLGGLAGVIAPMVLYLFGLGIAMPNAIAAAMAPHGRMAGVCSSLIGALQTLTGAAAGAAVGMLYRHSSVSLSCTAAVFACGAGVAYLATARSQLPSASRSVPE